MANYHRNTSIMEWSECIQTVSTCVGGSNGSNIGQGSTEGAGLHRVNAAVQQHRMVVDGIIHHNQHHHQQHHIAAAPTIKNHSVTHFNGYLYCFGGYDGRRNHMTLLLYSIKQQQWIRPYHICSSSLMSMSNKNSGVAVQSDTNLQNQQVMNSDVSSSTVLQPSNQIFDAGSNRNAEFFRMNAENNVANTSIFNANASSPSRSSHILASYATTASTATSTVATAVASGGNVSDASIIVHGTPPPGRNGHSATLATDPDDEEQGRIIIIGGWLGTGPLAASDMHVLNITHLKDNIFHSQAGTESMPIDHSHGVGIENSGCRQLLQWYQPAVKGTAPGACNMHSADYVISRKEVYVFRGGNGREYLNDLHALHVDTLTWRKVHCTGMIPQQRANHSSAILDNPSGKKSELFIFGGWNGTERLNDIHVLDTETSNWTAPHVSGVLPHPRAGMTLTALRGRLYLFGGSGTSAKCFQDLQIFDRHEMAWLDVVSDCEQRSGNKSHNPNSTTVNDTGNNIVHHGSNRTYDPYNHRFRFGGSRIYEIQHNSVLDDPASSTLLLAGGADSSSDIEARPQQGGTQEYGDSSLSWSTGTATNNNCWRASRRPYSSNYPNILNDDTRDGLGPLSLPYSSPNPNDEDAVPSVLVHGHGPGRRAGHTATAVNRKIYIFGGSCGSDYLNDFFVLDTDPPPSAAVTETNPLLLMEQRLRHFFNDPEFADVVFVVGENKDKVYCHKMVLSIVSDCFRAMFTNGFKESAAMEICIPDCSHSAFLAVMEYIYTGNLKAPSVLLPAIESNEVINDHPNQYSTNHSLQQPSFSPLPSCQPQHVVHAQNLTRVVEMLELADRFFLDHLKQLCESMLQSAVQGDTIEYLLSVAQKTNSAQLQAICLHHYRNNHRLAASEYAASANYFAKAATPY